MQNQHHQLSQYPLLALQQNFSHILPPYFPDSLHLNNSTSQHHHESHNQESHHHQQHHHHHHHHHHTRNNQLNTAGGTATANNNFYQPSPHYRQHKSSTHSRNFQNWLKSNSQNNQKSARLPPTGAQLSLLDLSAKVVAEHIPFQSVEQRYEHIPEPVQRRIIFWSFPRHEDDIKMYSSLSSDTFNSNAPISSPVNASNTTTQSPSSTSSFSWIDQQSSAQGNSTSNQATSTVKQNAKLLTFHEGLRLYDEGCVQDALQVGFNLSGLVKMRLVQPIAMKGRNRNAVNNAYSHLQNNNDNNSNQNQVVAISADASILRGDTQTAKNYRVSVTFDRCKITSVSCSCELQDIFWCEHAVALIIHRIRNPETIDLRIPISETLSNLDRQQLQKLVQYIIAEHHTEVLPTAQRLLDEMRQSYSEINKIQGAPDPTAGACSHDEHIWHLDENQVNEKVQNYLNSIATSSKEAGKQIQALFEKIREMFRAKDSNGTRLLKLITEQFLLNGNRNEKHRPYWDQLVFLWAVAMLNPDITKLERGTFLQLLNNWSRQAKCPKEDLERRVFVRRSVTTVSDDEDSDDNSSLSVYQQMKMYNDFTAGRGNLRVPPTPAHISTHPRNSHPPHVSPFNRLAFPASSCPCQIYPNPKKIKTDHQPNNDRNGLSSRGYRPSSSSTNHAAPPRLQNANEHRPAIVQEPKSIFQRAIDFKDASWDDPFLLMILNKDGPMTLVSGSTKSYPVDFAGNPLWHEPISEAAARIETLRSYGYREQALRLTVASIRGLKFKQNQWCIRTSPGMDANFHPCDLDVDSEGWIGNPFDPINVMLDLLLSASVTEPNNNIDTNSESIGFGPLKALQCSCPYNQYLVDITQRILPDLAALSHQQRNETFPPLPWGNISARRVPNNPSNSSGDSKSYYHVPIPGACCQKDSYLTLGFELALMALSQQRYIPAATTAHDRAVRQEADLISRLETIDTSDRILVEILQHQTEVLLRGGPFRNSCCGITADSAPLHTFAKYLFESLVQHKSDLAYRVGICALKMPLSFDENIENMGAARTSPRYTSNQTHLQNEQLSLAQTMLSRAREEKAYESFLRKVYRSSVKNIRNPINLHKLSKHALKEAKSNSTPQHQTASRAVLQTAFDLGMQVLKMTLNPQSTNSKTRRDAILFIVECATDMGLEAIVQVMKDARENFTASEALSLVVSRDTDPINNLRTQALSKLKLNKNTFDEVKLSRRSRDLALDCAARDPTNCALEVIKFCEDDDESLSKALKIVIEAGINGAMDSTQLIKVADHVYERKMIDRAFEISMVAVDGLAISSNLDNPSAKKDIFSACEYASKVNGFSILIPKLLNIESAYVLSEIYHRFSPESLMVQAYRNYANDVITPFSSNLSYNKEYNAILSMNRDLYKPTNLKLTEDSRWWDALLRRTMKSFVDTTRTKLQNISPRHYGEFIDFLIKAQGIFEKAADGPKQFKDLILEIVKSYRTKKKLMEKLKVQFEVSK